MKKLSTLLLFSALTLIVSAQTPQKMSYQGVIRNSSGELIANQVIGMKISVLQGSNSGSVVFSETYTPKPQTNENGLVTVEIGSGNPSAGTFSGIDWANGPYFIKMQIDPVGGTNYSIEGTSQLLSVPYALFAENSAAYDLQHVVDKGNSAQISLSDLSAAAISLTANGGNSANTNYYGIKSTIKSTNGYPTAIYGLADGNSLQRNIGLFGIATNADILNIGICGYAYGSKKDSYAIWGNAEGAVDGWDNRGMIGYAVGATQSGWNYGVTSWVGNSEYRNIAVGAYADNGSTANSITYAVVARASITNSSGTNYGVFSTASKAATNYAGFFNGNVTITGTLTQPSDKNLKEEIETMGSILDKIDKLRPVSFHYKTSKGDNSLQLPENLQYGFVAQELESVFPELVSTHVLDASSAGAGGRNEGEVPKSEESTKIEFKGVNYTGLISILAKGIKEQQTQIKDLQEKNRELETRLRLLEELILLK